ncbi:MAG: DDE-type integrase/transposase/recombinase [Thermoplasmata archaeon]
MVAAVEMSVVATGNQPNAEKIDKVSCKFCESDNLIKWGKQNGHQRYRCKDCKHVFDDNGRLPRMRNETDIIATALDLYFEGLSLRKVQRHLKRRYGVKVAFQKILEWIEKYVPIVEDFTDSFDPVLSGIWHSDETVLKFQWEKPKTTAKRRPGIQWWFWDAIDHRTRFLVGCHLSKERSIEEGETFLRNCEKAGGRPNAIISDHLQAYHGAINKVFYSRYKHRKVKHMPTVAIPKTRIRVHNQMIERFHGTLDDRVDVMRGLKSHNTKVLRGFRIHYNWLRPHESLDYKTPAEAAAINLPFEDGWGDLIRWAVYRQNKPENGNESAEIELVAEN